MPLKTPAIVALLEQLNLEARGWTVVGHWDSDECAIGVARADRPRQLVYVSTFEPLPERFFYECEQANGTDPTDYEVTDWGEDVDLTKLIEVLESHLS